jgi:hypothetical protein
MEVAWVKTSLRARPAVSVLLHILHSRAPPWPLQAVKRISALRFLMALIKRLSVFRPSGVFRLFGL